MADLDPLLTEGTVANQLGWSKKALQRRRWRGLPPEFVKIGRSVRYRQSIIRELIEAGRRTSTADPGKAA